MTACGNPLCPRLAGAGGEFCCWPCRTAAGAGQSVAAWTGGGLAALCHSAGCEKAADQASRAPLILRVRLPGGAVLTRRVLRW